jgi:hypothetical protein
MRKPTGGLLTSVALAMVLFLSTACVGSSGLKQCGLETRGVGASGRVALTDGISTANGSASMGEAREPGRPDTEVATVDIFAQSYDAASSMSSDFLRGHITGIQLRTTETPTRLVGSYNPPAPLLLPPNLFAFSGSYNWVLSIDESRALVLAGQLVLALQTDISNQPEVRIPLTVLAPNNSMSWYRTSGDGCA